MGKKKLKGSCVNQDTGIDTLALYTPRYAMALSTLAEARGVDPEKFHTGLGQYVMSVPPPGEDIVTMAANAAHQALRDCNRDEIEMVLFATESGVDQSKAAGIYVHGLLGLSARCRVVELKQACYGATAGIQLACSFLRDHPLKKVLLIASDIARYGLKTTGESSQGAGAVAMVLSTNPRILVIEKEYGIMTENVMDFWRPNYAHEAFVDGKYSSKLYLTLLEKCWNQYRAESGRHFHDHDFFCYHTPVPRLVEKAHQHLLKINQLPLTENSGLQASLDYARHLGNSYAAALYISLASLLDKTSINLSGKRIGFYSYGSGCVAEYFSGIVQPRYREGLNTAWHKQLLSSRKSVSCEEYETFFNFRLAEDGSEQVLPVYDTGQYRLTHMQQHKRIYAPVPAAAIKPVFVQSESRAIKVYAPGKLILSGEHAVVYGQPALAMAVNRYVTATVTEESVPQVLFDLSDLAYRSHLTLDGLRQLKTRMKQKYYRFIRGEYGIRDVLQKPFELAQFAMSIFANSLNLVLPQGVKLQVQSSVPIGCGMGSSAATIVSVMQALSRYTRASLSEDDLYSLALEAENMQHGYSSGLDLRVAMQGGCIYLQEDRYEARALPTMPLYLINTGTPATSTGQCVEKVAPFFKSTVLCEEFAAITHAMDQALQQQSEIQMKTAITANHQLLSKIGVVPEKVQYFISQVEIQGGAAKVCGAGAIAGEKAGVVLVTSENPVAVSSLAERFGYQVLPIMGESRGAHAA